MNSTCLFLNFFTFYRRAYRLLRLFCSSNGHWAKYPCGCLGEQLWDHHSGQHQPSVQVRPGCPWPLLDFSFKYTAPCVQQCFLFCRDFSVSCSEDIAIDRENPKWYYYFLCGVKGIRVSSSVASRFSLHSCITLWFTCMELSFLLDVFFDFIYRRSSGSLT